MRSSCISPPTNNRFIQIHEWQVQFCDGNHCSALLLSFFTAWHDWKIKNDSYYAHANDIAEMHGDGRPHNQNAYLFFSTEDLIEGTLSFYGKNSINEALQLLVNLGVLSIHKNPIERYKFDKTKYFRFYPGICNLWIAENYPVLDKDSPINSQHIDYSDRPKEDTRSPKKEQPSSETGNPSFETGNAITNTTSNTTNNTTNNNHSINARTTSFDPSPAKTPSPEPQPVQPMHPAQPVIDALKAQGMPDRHLSYPDIPDLIQRLCEEGASVEDFIAAFERAQQYAERGFGVKYLIRVLCVYPRKCLIDLRLNKKFIL